MRNLRMQGALERLKAIDVSQFPRVPDGDYAGCYILSDGDGRRFEDDKDYCDAVTEEWIWSVGRNEAGLILASTTPEFYQREGWECLWLR